jgi:UDP-glucose 4-epimerase
MGQRDRWSGAAHGAEDRTTMRVLVTGASGFLGSHVADAALARGMTVRTLDAVASRWHAPGAVEAVVGDVRDAGTVAAAMQDVDAVYHLAAVADLSEANSDPERAIDVNVEGTRTVVAAAQDHGVHRLLLASSVYVHSRAGGTYRDSKRAAEALVRAAHGDRLSTTVLRFGSLYGPRSDPGNAVRRILTQALVTGRIEFWGDGTEVREYAHVHDAACLALDALDDRHAGALLHLTGRERITTRELLELVSEMMGGITLSFEDRPFEGRYRLTPFTLTDEPVELGRTLVGDSYIDLGLGLLQTLQDLRAELGLA